MMEMSLISCHDSHSFLLSLVLLFAESFCRIVVNQRYMGHIAICPQVSTYVGERREQSARRSPHTAAHAI